MPSDPPSGPLVVDANVLFSALLRDGATRHVILFSRLNLHTPAALWDEFEAHRAYLLEKSRATEAAFDLLLRLLKERIRSVPTEVIRPHLGRAERALAATDPSDAPYLATALAIGGGIWTHDKPFSKKAGVRVWSTAEILAGTRG